MRRITVLLFVVLILTTVVAPAATVEPAVRSAGADGVLVRAAAADIHDIAYRHGLEVVRAVRSAPDADGSRLYLLRGPAWRDARQVSREVLDLSPEAFNAEPALLASIPETSGAAVLDPSHQAVLTALDATWDATFGTQTAWSGYVDQPAVGIVDLEPAGTGAGVTVAVVDTGVDPDHPVLAPSLVPGYDFVADVAGEASEWSDLLDHSTMVILQGAPQQLSGDETAVSLNHSTMVILQGDEAGAVDPDLVPPAFGHGTMVAGIVHRAAPGAAIMPLRAFTADGTGNLADIIDAVYYAVAHGADVINMSFSMTGFSSELALAVHYATVNGVVCVAAAGNDGAVNRPYYPASFGSAIGVAATDLDDSVASFSNVGWGLSMLAAPGEYAFTTYPGGGWAIAAGTSFATPWVVGAGALTLETEPSLQPLGVMGALSNAAPVNGWKRIFITFGRLDVDDALAAVGSQAAGAQPVSGGGRS